MRKRLLAALATMALIMAMLPGVASANHVGKVTICHIPPGNADMARTLSVGIDALAAHLRHGDTIGPCP